MSGDEFKERVQTLLQEFYDDHAGGNMHALGGDAVALFVDAAENIAPDDDDWVDGIYDGARGT